MALSLTLNYGDDDMPNPEYEPSPSSLGGSGQLYYPADLVRLAKCPHCEETYISKEALNAHECPNPPMEEDNATDQ